MVLVSLVSTLAMAEVEVMSLERDKVRGIQRFSEVSLKCSGSVDKRIIQRSSKHGAHWCVSDAPGLCDKRKYALADTVCGYSDAEFVALSKSQNPVVTDRPLDSQRRTSATESRKLRRARLLNEQMLIEEQRIQIEQRRLELVRLELSLKRNLVASSGVGD